MSDREREIYPLAFYFIQKSDEESSFHKDRIDQAKLIMKPFILRRVKIEVSHDLTF